ncbi:ATP-binding cassette domain-containing protein [Actinomadura roseirufa]|uniref:ATP-binding cassette domain-containing protein n=1 Tax=Actinomadura roseirufa TaxID=2094049 RepID=UPI001A954F84|nr:ATP-binding cassette domain-containing protein [Actinomadura roseirufa]
MSAAIEVRGLAKRYRDVVALAGVDLTVPQGTVHGLLGHNGAGKTTLVDVLATRARPSAGTARVAGLDVVRQARHVRRRIGLTGQYASIDEQLGGRDNLVLLARLLGARRAEARARADELLQLFGLTASATRPARTYSGGMRRRLDLAAALVNGPRVILLDEPTTGLDPAGRLDLWRIVRALVQDGAAVLLTTQYLDEADRLSDTITVLSRGRVVAGGTPAELKHRVGRRSATVRFAAAADLEAAGRALRRGGFRPAPAGERRAVTVPVERAGELAALVRVLDDAGLEPDELLVADPTLDEVYLALMSDPAATPEAVR